MGNSSCSRPRAKTVQSLLAVFTRNEPRADMAESGTLRVHGSCPMTYGPIKSATILGRKEHLHVGRRAPLQAFFADSAASKDDYIESRRARDERGGRGWVSMRSARRRTTRAFSAGLGNSDSSESRTGQIPEKNVASSCSPLPKQRSGPDTSYPILKPMEARHAVLVVERHCCQSRKNNQSGHLPQD